MLERIWGSGQVGKPTPFRRAHPSRTISEVEYYGRNIGEHARQVSHYFSGQDSDSIEASWRRNSDSKEKECLHAPLILRPRPEVAGTPLRFHLSPTLENA